jgi:hypothetical protein
MVVRVLPSPRTADEAEAERKERDDRAAAERDLTSYSGYLALATCGLVFVAVVQAGFFVWQLILLNRSVRDARTAANAASASADAAREQAQASTRSANTSEETFRLLERPYLFAFGVKELRVNAQVVGGLEPFVTYDIANHGKTPAIVENIRAGFSTGEIHPETPLRVDEDHSLLISPIMAAGEIRRNLKDHLPDGIATRGLWVSNNDTFYPIRAPEIAKDWDLFYWIIVEYRGPFSQKHESSFCWRFHKGEKLFVQYGGEEYNYVR